MSEPAARWRTAVQSPVGTADKSGLHVDVCSRPCSYLCAVRLPPRRPSCATLVSVLVTPAQPTVRSPPATAAGP